MDFVGWEFFLKNLKKSAKKRGKWILSAREGSKSGFCRLKTWILSARNWTLSARKLDFVGQKLDFVGQKTGLCRLKWSKKLDFVGQKIGLCRLKNRILSAADKIHSLKFHEFVGWRGSKTGLCRPENVSWEWILSAKIVDFVSWKVAKVSASRHFQP